MGMLWDCDGSQYQAWRMCDQKPGRLCDLVPTGGEIWPGTHIQINGGMPGPKGKFCLDAGDMSVGSELFIWSCNGYPSQQFHLDGEWSREWSERNDKTYYGTIQQGSDQNR